MADNTTLPPTGTGTADIKVATRKVTYSGDANQDAQVVGLVTFAGSDDAKTVADVPGGAGTEANTLRVTLPTDGTGQIAAINASVTPGTAAANLGKAEDGAHTTGDVGVMALGVRKDTPVTTAGTDSDYVPLISNLSGQLHVAEVAPSAIATAQTNISNSAATLIGSRATRRRLVIINRQLEAVYVGPATVTTANGVQVDPGASLTLYTTALIQGITSAATLDSAQKCHTIEEYD